MEEIYKEIFRVSKDLEDLLKTFYKFNPGIVHGDKPTYSNMAQSIATIMRDLSKIRTDILKEEKNYDNSKE